MERLVHLQFINNAAKFVEKEMLRKFKKFISWTSIVHFFNPCVICYYKSEIKLDYEKYKQIKKSLLKGDFI